MQFLQRRSPSCGPTARGRPPHNPHSHTRPSLYSPLPEPHDASPGRARAHLHLYNSGGDDIPSDPGDPNSSCSRQGGARRGAVVQRHIHACPSGGAAERGTTPAGSGGRRRGTPRRAAWSRRTGPGSGRTWGRGRRFTAPGSAAAGASASTARTCSSRAVFAPRTGSTTAAPMPPLPTPTRGCRGSATCPWIS